MQTQVAANRVYDFSHSVGKREIAAYPYSFALAGNDVVYVVNRQLSSKVQFSVGAAEMKLVSKIGIGTGPGQEELLAQFVKMGDSEDKVMWPAGIQCDGDDNVYIADEWLNRILIFDSGGSFIENWGSTGQGEGELFRPSGLQLDADENLYVVDAGNHRVQKFTKSGTFLGGWGSKGAGPGEFNSPWGITIDHEDYVYVVDHKNSRVQKFTSEGEFAMEIGSFGEGVGELNRPSDVAVDPDGDIYVADWANHRVNVYDKDGTCFTSFTGDSVQLSKWQQETVDANVTERLARRRVPSLEPSWRFGLPCCVEFDAEKGWLMVGDTQRCRIQIYSKLDQYAEPQFNL